MKAKDLVFFEQTLNEKKEQLQNNIRAYTTEHVDTTHDELKDEGDLASASGGAIISDAIIAQQKKNLPKLNMR